MNKIKVMLALLLTLCLVLSAAACGKDEEENSSDDATAAIAESGDSGADESAASAAESSEEFVIDDGPAVRDPDYKALNYDTMKGIWISQYDTELYKSGGAQRDQKNFTDRCDKICKGISDMGFNTIVVQVRPNGDSFYPSEVYPPSTFVTGGYNKEFKYDPIKIFVAIAHKYSLSFHAWINPMRLMSPSQIKNVSTDYRIGQWYQDESLRDQYLSAFGDNYYLVPGYDESRQLVCDGVTEICKNYNVDAVHIDDYFYPTSNLDFDDQHFETVKDDYVDIRFYRIEKVNQMVKEIYNAVKAVKEDIVFGISPQGNVSNNVNSLYADVRAWSSHAGYCDYIAPQVYWGFEYPAESSRFDVCTEEWVAMNTAPEVKLVVGMGIYRMGEASANNDFKEYFEKKDNVKRQLEYLQKTEGVGGFIMYCYSTILDDFGRPRTSAKAEIENFTPVLQAYE